MKSRNKSKNFWLELQAKAQKGEPFFALAPMYDVTDEAFRQMFVKYSKEVRDATSRSQVVSRTPLVLFTEFVSADGLASEEGRPKLLRELYFAENERPIVAQIFGSRPETIEVAAKLVCERGFDGLDINMGCPDRAVEKQGAGSALIKNPKLAQEIIAAAKRGARSASSGQADMPVLVKTRLGYNKIDLTWIEKVLEAKPAALTVHLRTRKEMSEAKAHLEVIPDLVRLAHEAGVPLIINGDIKSVEEGENLAKKYGVDGLMIGRGAFGKPWIFASEEVRRSWTSGSLEVQLHLAIEHSQLFEKLYLPGPTNDKLFHGHTKNFAVMRKHFKAYASGFKGATALRTKLMETQNSKEVEKVVKDFLS